MKQVVLIDFYGTLVHETGPVAQEVLARVCRAGREKDPRVVYGRWWHFFEEGMRRANEGPFQNQYALALHAFEQTLELFEAREDARSLCNRMIDHWSSPEPFPEAKAFVERLPVPYYIVTNADAEFLQRAVQRMGLRPAGLVTSEKAGAYKPDRRIFEAALRQAGVLAQDAVHIGDSAANDRDAARAVGIDALWLDRGGSEGFCDLNAVWEALQKMDARS